VIAFAIKVPVWPFHTWLPDAHTEAPTAGSMILAGVLLKLGATASCAWCCRFTRRSAAFMPACWPSWLMAIIFGALASTGRRFQAPGGLLFGQPHGLCGAGHCRAPMQRQAANMPYRLNGAVLQMFNHGLSAAGMFFLVGVIYERTHTRNLNEYGGCSRWSRSTAAS
jgi:NADH-quinone oxidoreductase subunit M